MNATGLHWWSVNIGSGNGLVPSGNKPLPEPMLTQNCCHMASLGHNELMKDCGNSIANALELLQSCYSKPSKYLIQTCTFQTCSDILGVHDIKHQNSTLLALSGGNPPVTGGFPSQRASNVGSVSMSCLHDEPTSSEYWSRFSCSIRTSRRSCWTVASRRDSSCFIRS